MINLVVLVSGRGSNMACLADAIENYGIAATITLVIGNKDCAGIARARDRGIPTKIVESKDFDNRADFDLAIAETIHSYRADYVFLAGYMAILGRDFVDQFAGRLVNIHPSLLPAFRGLETHQRAIDEKVATHGVSVHLVSTALDDGPMIIQASLPILAGDTAATLAARILKLEHQVYPFVLFGLAKKFLSLSPEGAIWHSPTSALADAPMPIQKYLEACLIWPVPSADG